jgi:hypothetical protein
MGAPSAQVQPSQSSAPASKGAGISPSTPAPAGKGTSSMSAISGQPAMGQPNTNGNAGLAPVNPSLNSVNDVKYANTVEPTGDGRNAMPNAGFGKGSNF